MRRNRIGERIDYGCSIVAVGVLYIQSDNINLVKKHHFNLNTVLSKLLLVLLVIISSKLRVFVVVVSIGLHRFSIHTVTYHLSVISLITKHRALHLYFVKTVINF